ncbi:MAG: DUF3800 domain-containing protein [Chthoniobacterales bacterium]
MATEKEGELPLFELTDPAQSAPVRRLPASAHPAAPPPFSKYIVYVDESGDHGMENIDIQFPVFVLAFCVFHKVHYSEKVVPALEKFKFKHFGHDQIVLHESEIRKERGCFRIFPTRKHKEDFLDELTSCIEASNFILISCVINKQSLSDQQEKPPNPYHIALRFCLETLHDFLKEKGEEHNRTHVVVEQRGKKEDNELELEFRRICDGRNTSEADLPFEILFADKKAMSSGLQLADLVARPIGLHVFRGDQENRAFEVLEKKFFCAGGRNQVGAAYQNWGLKIFPTLESERPR